VGSSCQVISAGPSEKTRDGLARLRAKSRRVSRIPPYGFALGPGGRLVPRPEEQVVLAEIVTLRTMRHSLRAVARALAGRGV